MIIFKNIEIEEKNHHATVWLNRPDVRNAFDEKTIEELIEAFEYLNNAPDIRTIILRGRGEVFCAGADLNWMREVAQYDRDDNYKESLNLSKCFHVIYTSIKPTIAMVQGAAIGGANGLLSACDIVLADENAIFSLSEVKIGVVPACIAPYVIKRVGEFRARELMLTGKRITGREASQIGLVNYAVKKADLKNVYEDTLNQLQTAGPKAVSICKQLIHSISNHWSLEDAYTKTAEIIADIRMSEEGQEGMSAFLEKRKPKWITENN